MPPRMVEGEGFGSSRGTFQHHIHPVLFHTGETRHSETGTKARDHHRDTDDLNAGPAG